MDSTISFKSKSKLSTNLLKVKFYIPDSVKTLKKISCPAEIICDGELYYLKIKKGFYPVQTVGRFLTVKIITVHYYVIPTYYFVFVSKQTVIRYFVKDAETGQVFRLQGDTFERLLNDYDPGLLEKFKNRNLNPDLDIMTGYIQQLNDRKFPEYSSE